MTARLSMSKPTMYVQVSERERPAYFVVRLRPEPNAADPLKALQWILRTSQQQFGLQCIGINIQEESAPCFDKRSSGKDTPAFAETSRRREVAPDIPVVPVRRSQCGCQLIVAACPHCGAAHAHGDAGRRSRGNHGHRIAHCRRPPTPGAGYVLVEVAEPVTWVKSAEPPCW
jgi:hypothetical protein